MEPWQIAVLVKPFVMLVLAALVLYPCRKLTERYFPEGRIKRLLLRRIN